MLKISFKEYKTDRYWLTALAGYLGILSELNLSKVLHWLKVTCLYFSKLEYCVSAYPSL